MESLLDITPGERYPVDGKHTFHRRGGMKNRLESLRRERGITQEELAAALEVSRQTIGSLENGRYNPSILLAFKIAHFFSVRIEDIFIYEKEEI
jgi:putative transcriptional regulator